MLSWWFTRTPRPRSSPTDCYFSHYIQFQKLKARKLFMNQIFLQMRNRIAIFLKFFSRNITPCNNKALNLMIHLDSYKLCVGYKNSVYIYFRAKESITVYKLKKKDWIWHSIDKIFWPGIDHEWNYLTNLALSASRHVQHRCSPKHELHVHMSYLATVNTFRQTNHADVFFLLFLARKQHKIRSD